MVKESQEFVDMTGTSGSGMPCASDGIPTVPPNCCGSVKSLVSQHAPTLPTADGILNNKRYADGISPTLHTGCVNVQDALKHT